MTSTLHQTIDSLSPREFELLILEVPLLEQRIAQIENLQYRLKQFSITLWAVLITAGMGLTKELAPNTWILALAVVIPAIFFYLDALYATVAQSHRTRRDRLIEFVNKSAPDTQDGVREIPLLDLTGKSTDWDDPQAAYRRSMLVKLTRDTRLSFYGVQLVGAAFALGWLVADEGSGLAPLGYSLGPMMILSLAGLWISRILKRHRTIKRLPVGYSRVIDNLADGTPLEEWRRTPLLQPDSAPRRR